MNNSTTRPPQPVPIKVETQKIVTAIDLNLHHHSLEHLNNRKGNNYTDGFCCDFCGAEKSNSDFSFHCATCPLDCCEDCYKTASSGKRNDKSTHEHLLIPEAIDRDDYVCDICEHDIPNGYQCWQCKKCQFSACIKCYYKNK